MIQRAKVDPPLASYPGIEERAVCPLCGDGTNAFGSRGGFAYPRGLERHLTGTAICTNARVLGMAFKLSADYLNETSLATDRTEKERDEERRQSELMVRHAAQAPPAFLYQTEWRGPARGEATMGEAEQRLRDLGFEIMVEGNVRTYRFVQHDWLVLADPRVTNKIEFEVTSLSKPKKKPRHWRANTFYMLDSYALDIPGKLRKRLQEAIESFGDAAKSLSRQGLAGRARILLCEDWYAGLGRA
ncbi:MULTISPECIES: hypothetical protein [unclassified Bradyrhizobium]|uniref:hypothetical protein n=1 Tax=unclassified Bradyrhizobium TaxID=2631580 RepID=UPI003397C52C